MTWPSGTVDILNNISADQVIHVVENSSSLSVNEFDQNDIRIYPNPVNDILNISSDRQLKEVKLFNVLQQEVLKIEPNQNGTLDISSLNSGIYFLHVYGDNDSKWIQKIIKIGVA